MTSGWSGTSSWTLNRGWTKNRPHLIIGLANVYSLMRYSSPEFLSEYIGSCNLGVISEFSGGETLGLFISTHVLLQGVRESSNRPGVDFGWLTVTFANFIANRTTVDPYFAIWTYYYNNPSLSASQASSTNTHTPEPEMFCILCVTISSKLVNTYTIGKVHSVWIAVLAVIVIADQSWY